MVSDPIAQLRFGVCLEVGDPWKAFKFTFGYRTTFEMSMHVVCWSTKCHSRLKDIGGGYEGGVLWGFSSMGIFRTHNLKSQLVFVRCPLSPFQLSDFRCQYSTKTRSLPMISESPGRLISLWRMMVLTNRHHEKWPGRTDKNLSFVFPKQRSF